MLEENLITTLEQSLRQTKNARSRLIERLETVKSEIDGRFEEIERLCQEIDALKDSERQTEAAIKSLLSTIKKK